MSIPILTIGTLAEKEFHCSSDPGVIFIHNNQHFFLQYCPQTLPSLLLRISGVGHLLSFLSIYVFKLSIFFFKQFIKPSLSSKKFDVSYRIYIFLYFILSNLLCCRNILCSVVFNFRLYSTLLLIIAYS